MRLWTAQQRLRHGKVPPPFRWLLLWQVRDSAGQSLLNELLNYSSMEGTKEHGFSSLEDLAKVISFHMSRALTQDTRRWGITGQGRGCFIQTKGRSRAAYGGPEQEVQSQHRQAWTLLCLLEVFFWLLSAHLLHFSFRSQAFTASFCMWRIWWPHMVPDCTFLPTRPGSGPKTFRSWATVWLTGSDGTVTICRVHLLLKSILIKQCQWQN